jgi:hypothetical protein
MLCLLLCLLLLCNLILYLLVLVERATQEVKLAVRVLFARLEDDIVVYTVVERDDQPIEGPAEYAWTTLNGLFIAWRAGRMWYMVCAMLIGWF